MRLLNSTDPIEPLPPSRPNPQSAINWFAEVITTANSIDPSRCQRHLNAIEKLATLGWTVSRSPVTARATRS